MDERKIVPDTSLSIREGAVVPWRRYFNGPTVRKGSWGLQQLKALRRKWKIDFDRGCILNNGEPFFPFGVMAYRVSGRDEHKIADIAAMGAVAPSFCSKADQLRFLLEYLDRDRLDADDRRWLRRVQTQSDRLRDIELERLRRGAVFDPPISPAERNRHDPSEPVPG